MSWKKALLVALVVLLVMFGIPVLMPGMGAAMCSECGPAINPGQACSMLAVLAGFALAVTLLASQLRARHRTIWDLLRSVDFERPPQLA